MKQSFIVALVAFLTACSSSTPTPSETIPETKPGGGVITQPPAKSTRPEGSPDVFVLAVSGKCFFDDYGKPCFNILPSETLKPKNTRNNYDYLSTKGTTFAVANRISKLGYVVGYKGFAASLFDRENSGTGELKTHLGFTSLVANADEIFQKYIKGFSNPSKIVLLAHSHGVVWSHLLTKFRPSIPVEAQIDLDGVCAYWSTDNKGDFSDTRNTTDIDYSDFCALQDPTDGGKPNDLQNLVFPNVKWNFEAQASNDFILNKTIVHDGFNNHRINGAFGADAYIFSLQFPVNHSKVTDPSSEAMDWILKSMDIIFKK